MSTAHMPPPSWAEFAVRAAIYAAVAALAFWWHPVLGGILALFGVIDLLHHAADTARRRSGYVPIPRHPSLPGAPKAPLRRTGRALMIVFVLVWAATAVIGKALLGTTWAEALLQSLALAGFIAMIAALLFPLAAIALLWTMSVSLGVLLSLADLLAIFTATPEARRVWHRAVDATDHRLADLVLGQDAMIPLRADLAERAAEDARTAKGQT